MDFAGSSEGITRNGNASRVWKGEMAAIAFALGTSFRSALFYWHRKSAGKRNYFT
jgi:hypothetical protein